MNLASSAGDGKVKGRPMKAVRLLIGALLLCLPVWSHADTMLGSIESIEVEVLSKSTSMWNGQPIPPYAQGTPEISVVRVTIPPGQSLPLHEHPFATAGVLLQGHLEVRTPNGQQAELHAGEALIELVNQPHAGANIGDIPAVILVVYAGIKGEPVTRMLSAADAEPL
jgi:quercetin dioxygenase-like cupin family protein